MESITENLPAGARQEKMIKLGCVVCRVYYEVHSEPHIYRLQGIGHRVARLKSDDSNSVPLCYRHLQNGSNQHPSLRAQPKLFEERFGTQEDLLEMTNQLIALIQ